MNPVEVEMDFPAEHGGNVFGQFDAYMKKIEQTLHVSLILRDGRLKCIGQQKAVQQAVSVIEELLELSKRGNIITEQNVNYTLSLSMDDQPAHLIELDEDVICHTVQGKAVKPKTLGQKKYTEKIRDKMITFGVGPAGTGKTYLAMAMAITAFKNDEVQRIILTRPYLRPLYDALYEILGADAFMKNMEKGLIEVAPLAYMRGRTLDNAYIILDEAQNTTPAQMKMFLTRIGFGSKAVITGDLTQKDLPFDHISGLEEALKVLEKVKDIGICRLTNKDVVRHPLVQQIVAAYDKYEASKNSGKGKNGRKKTKDR